MWDAVVDPQHNGTNLFLWLYSRIGIGKQIALLHSEAAMTVEGQCSTQVNSASVSAQTLKVPVHKRKHRHGTLQSCHVHIYLPRASMCPGSFWCLNMSKAQMWRCPTSFHSSLWFWYISYSFLFINMSNCRMLHISAFLHQGKHMISHNFAEFPHFMVWLWISLLISEGHGIARTSARGVWEWGPYPPILISVGKIVHQWIERVFSRTNRNMNFQQWWLIESWFYTHLHASSS